MKVLSDLVTYINNLPPTKRLILIIIVIVIIVFLIDFVKKSMKSNYRNVTNHSIENMEDTVSDADNSNYVSTENNEVNNTPAISAPNMLEFREVMMNTDILNMTLFYAEWCGHCKSLMPTWNALTDLIPKDLINMVKISCVKKQKECSAIKEITGYPTIIFVDMKAGQTVIFNGKRNPESIIEFINECMGGEVLKLD